MYKDTGILYVHTSSRCFLLWQITGGQQSKRKVNVTQFGTLIDSGFLQWSYSVPNKCFLDESWTLHRFVGIRTNVYRLLLNIMLVKYISGCRLTSKDVMNFAEDKSEKLWEPEDREVCCESVFYHHQMQYSYSHQYDHPNVIT